MKVVTVSRDNIIDAFRDSQSTVDAQAVKKRKLDTHDVPPLIPLFKRHLKFKHELEGKVSEFPETEIKGFRLEKGTNDVFTVKFTKKRVRALFSFSLKQDAIPDVECLLLMKKQQDGIVSDRKLVMSVKRGVFRAEIEYSVGYVCDMHHSGKRDVMEKVLPMLDPNSVKKDTITPEYFYRSIADSTEEMPNCDDQEFDIPELQTELLRFQKKTVNWLLAKENVKYNPETNRVDPVLFMESEEFNEEEALKLVNSLWYGWKIISWKGEAYFFNQFTCSAATFHQVKSYLLDYYHDKDKLQNPLHLNGQGLLCEEMGLGKTIEVAALTLLNPRPYYQIDRPMDLVLNEFGDAKKIVMGRTTLIIAPGSILQQWRTELENFAPGLAVTIYGGLSSYPSMNNKPYLIATYLRKFDVVLTTYGTIARELDYAKFSSSHKRTRGARSKGQSNYKPIEEAREANDEDWDSDEDNRKPPPHDEIANNYQAMFQLSSLKPAKANQRSSSGQKETDYEKALQNEIELAIKHNEAWNSKSTDDYECPLMLIQFWRVVLDEVQMVSLRVSRAFQSASLIPRFHSWGVSGTPIKKNMDDLLATLKFLRFFPFSGHLGEYSWGKLIHNKEEFTELWNTLAIRHTKSMVHDDIQLPEQNRILMTMPFTAIEQDLYSRKFEQCLSEIKLDEEGNPLVDDWDIVDVVEQMRYWLMQLRKLCNLPQIGKLNFKGRKFPNSHGRVGSMGLGSLEPLKTLDALLRVMLEKCYLDILSTRKRKMDDVIKYIELLEFIYCPREALEHLSIAIIQTEWMVKRDEIMLVKKIADARRDGLYPDPVLAELDQRADKRGPDRDGRGDHYYYDGYEREIDMGIEQLTMRVLPRAGTESRYATKKSDDGFVANGDDSLIASITRLRARLRSSLVQLHKLYFLKATCNFQLEDPDYAEIMSKRKVEIETPPGGEADRTYKNKKQDAELASIVSGLPIDNFLFEVEEEAGDSISEPIELEEIYYEKAEKIRGRLLAVSMKGVRTSIETRIKSRGFYFEEPPIDYGERLLPKTSKKFFNAIPTMEVSDWEDYVMNPQVLARVNDVKAFVTALNDQAEVMNNTMKELLDCLQTPLIAPDEAPLGNEYEDTLNDQEKISMHITLLLQFIFSRSSNVSIGKASSSDPGWGTVKDFSSMSQMRSLLRQHLLPPDIEFSEFMDEINSLIIDLSEDPANGVQVEELKKLRDRLGIYLENQKLALVLFAKEVNTNCNAIFNARIEYYKQLQVISDTVERPTFADLDRDNLDPEMAETVLRMMHVRRSEHTESNVGRFRYLMGLMKENEKCKDGKNKRNSDDDDDDEEEEEEDNEDHEEDKKNGDDISLSMCTICHSTITLGALTHCGHKYCKACLDQWLRASHKCPLCKSSIERGSVYCYTRYEPVLRAKQVHDVHDVSKLHSIYKSLDEAVIEDLKSVQMMRSFSSKVDMIVKQVLYLRKTESNVQIIIFSQWPDMLYILGNALKDNGISFVGLNRSLNQDPRSKHRSFDEVSYFKKNNRITCFLMDAKAQASGLTLTNATHIFLCEPLVNISLELQAISRIHRIGQKKKTTVWMFAIENTIEESIIVTSTDKRLKYIKSNKRSNGDIEKVENDPDEDELTKAESLALVSGGGQDNVMSKSDYGEMVTTHDLWSAFFSSTMGRVIPDPSEKDTF
ncbi:putative ATP-dependent helicase IRC20 [Candida viswanathii]|uniref:Putative ATP-dependent helicase IRC20 n=1 Tax=Candida viswanathii TaxID=5486 RepID=A0A367XMV2_9ASCO|nr:putative ATP-dependent helicase IRC20 [Candida viswanathii]